MWIPITLAKIYFLRQIRIMEKKVDLCEGYLNPKRKMRTATHLFEIISLELQQNFAKNDNTSAIADHVKATGHNIKWDHFDILAKGKTDYHCKIKETLYIQELEPAFNVNVGSEKLMLY